MKGAFVMFGFIKDGKEIGIQKKVLSQIKAFNHARLGCELRCIPKG